MKEINFAESVPVKYREKIERQLLQAAERFGFNNFEINVDEHNICKVDSLPSALASIHTLPQISLPKENIEDGKFEAIIYDIDNVDDKVIGYFFGYAKTQVSNPRFSKLINFSVGNFLAEKILKVRDRGGAKAWIYSITGTIGLSTAMLISPLYSLIGIPVLYDGSTHFIRDVLAKREARKAGYEISYFE